MRKTLIALALVTAAVTAVTFPVQAQVIGPVAPVDPIVLDDSEGGQISTFLDFFKAIKASHVPVQIRGWCFSACTLVLMMPKEQLCVEPGALFGFHLATTGGGFTSTPLPEITQALYKRYMPAGVLAWLATKTLTSDLSYLTADEAIGLDAVAACAPDDDRV